MVLKKSKGFFISVAMLCSLLIPQSAHAFFTDGSGWVQVAYLSKILYENYQRYQQLKIMIEQARNQDQYIHLINSGLDNAIGLMGALPVTDEKVLAQFKSFKDGLKTLEQIYGVIPKSHDAAMQKVNDDAVAESLKVAGQLVEYADRQERNAQSLFNASGTASPKGAARMSAQANAQILHSLNQLLKVNGQLLKLQSAGLAMTNKNDKRSVANYQKVNNDVQRAYSGFSGDFNIPKF